MTKRQRKQINKADRKGFEWVSNTRKRRKITTSPFGAENIDAVRLGYIRQHAHLDMVNANYKLVGMLRGRTGARTIHILKSKGTAEEEA